VKTYKVEFGDNWSTEKVRANSIERAIKIAKRWADKMCPKGCRDITAIEKISDDRDAIK